MYGEKKGEAGSGGKTDQTNWLHSINAEKGVGPGEQVELELAVMHLR